MDSATFLGSIVCSSFSNPAHWLVYSLWSVCVDWAIVLRCIEYALASRLVAGLLFIAVPCHCCGRRPVAWLWWWLFLPSLFWLRPIVQVYCIRSPDVSFSYVILRASQGSLLHLACGLGGTGWKRWNGGDGRWDRGRCVVATFEEIDT